MQQNCYLVNSVVNQYQPSNLKFTWANVKLSTTRNTQWSEGFNVNNVWRALMSKPVYNDMCEVFMKKWDYFVTSVPNLSQMRKIGRNINCLSMKASKDTPAKTVIWALKINSHWLLMMTLSIRWQGSSVQSVQNLQLHKIGWKSIWIHIFNGNQIHLQTKSNGLDIFYLFYFGNLTRFSGKIEKSALLYFSMKKQFILFVFYRE